MTVTEQPSTTENRTVYIVVGVIVAVLAVIGLFTYSSGKSSQQAEQKATQFVAAAKAAGARVPSQDQVVRLYGDDGGAVCDDPAGALRKGILLNQHLMNGAAGPGMRPVIADNRVVKGQLLAMRIYCPDKLPSLQELVADLNLSDTVKG